jgi:hypothetical protein
MPNIDYSALINDEEIVEESSVVMSMRTASAPETEEVVWEPVAGYKRYSSVGQELFDNYTSYINDKKKIVMDTS